MSVLDEIQEEVATLWRKRQHACWFFHDWGKWRTIKLTYTSGPNVGKYAGEGQERYCARCGAVEGMAVKIR